jgi:hypothetical protein
MKYLIPVSVLLLSAQLYTSSVQADLKAEFQSAHDTFLSFVDGQDSDFKAAWRQFEQLDSLYPDHPAVQTYYGSLETIKASSVSIHWNKVKWVERGLERIARALTLITPKHQTEQLIGISIALDSRIAAVQTLLSVPKFLHRFDDARDLFADLLDTTDLESQPVVVQQRIFQLGMEIAEKSDDEQQRDEWSARLDAIPLDASSDGQTTQ